MRMDRLTSKSQEALQSAAANASRRGNPELKSVAALLKAMGIRLALQPLQPTRVRRHERPDQEESCL